MRNESEAREFSEPERYEADEHPRYRFDLDRRGFFGVAGGGLAISATQIVGSAQSGRAVRTGDPVASRIHIADDGAVTIMTGKVEVGQGSRAQITQAAAEELRVPVDHIKLVMADTKLGPDDGSTAGSRTTPSTVPAVRRGAAAAREILIELAGTKWGVGRDTLQAENGAVVGSGGQRATYADLVQSGDVATAFRRTIPSDIALHPVADWKALGVSTPRPNGRDIVTGAHRYPADISRPNMLYGKVLRPPSYGATLTDIDLKSAQQMEDVVVVRDGNFVGCAAPTSRQAQQAVDVISKTASWKSTAQPSSKDLYAYLKEHVDDEGGGRRRRLRERGSLAEGLAGAKNVTGAAYEIAYVQHAPMEPRAAVAEWKDGGVTCWTGTQKPHGVRDELSEAFRIPEDRVRVIVPDTGGGFGGKHTGDAALEAARLAKAAGRPVSLRWTREEEFIWAYFRPAGLIEIRAGVDAGGRISAWEFTNYNSGASALESPYDIPHAKELYRYSDSPLREGSYRALASTANTFARESFMDELASAANEDPLDYRLAQLTHPRLRPVLEASAKSFGWRQRRNEKRASRGIGLACGTEKGSYVAACAEVEVDRERGAIKVIEVCHAFECGAIHNPANLRAQVDGCALMTLGATLGEEINFENGRILNGCFSQYKVPRFRDTPRLNTVLLDRPDLPSVGAGETPMIAVPPAVGNAVFDACGVRVRSMPIRGSAIKRA